MGDKGNYLKCECLNSEFKNPGVWNRCVFNNENSVQSGAGVRSYFHQRLRRQCGGRVEGLGHLPSVEVTKQQYTTICAVGGILKDICNVVQALTNLGSEKKTSKLRLHIHVLHMYKPVKKRVFTGTLNARRCFAHRD